MMSAHVDSPFQKDYSPGTDASYDRHAEKLRAGVMQDGITLPSSTFDIHRDAEPMPVGHPLHEWYGVGGATDVRTGKRAPESNYNLSKVQFTKNDALKHVLDVEGANIERSRRGQEAVFAGGWNETDEATGEHHAVLDHSNVYTDELTARRQTAARGERAYFDARKITSKDSQGLEVA